MVGLNELADLELGVLDLGASHAQFVLLTRGAECSIALTLSKLQLSMAVGGRKRRISSRTAFVC